MFQYFVSYSHKDKGKVESIIKLLSAIFGNEITFWLDNIKINGGQSIPEKVKIGINKSDLFLLFCSSKSLLSPEVKKEFQQAISDNKEIIPIVIENNIDSKSLDAFLEGFGNRLFINLSDISNFDNIQRLINSIKDFYTSYVQGVILVLDGIDKLIGDIVQHKTSELKIFLIDGGTTIRKLFDDKNKKELLASNSDMKIKFLYLDTNFKEFIRDASAVREKKEIFNQPNDFFENIYEALLQASRAIHNRGPHIYDVKDSIGFFDQLANTNKSISLEVRKTSQLPLFRMIITDNFLYYTHFMLKSYLPPVQNYYSLKVKKDTEIYRAGKEYFDTIFEQAIKVR